MQRSGAQGYKDGRSREITTVRNQPITQGVLGSDLNTLTSSRNNRINTPPEKEEDIVAIEEFPSWAGNMKYFLITLCTANVTFVR